MWLSRWVTLEDQLVADVMAERVVDVLEMIEVDVEHGRGLAAGAHVVDHGFEPLAEIDAVGQAAHRIVQGEMAQLRFAGPDLFGGAPHVAQDEADEEGEAAERHHDERQHAADDGAARLRRLPGEAGDRVALRVGKFDAVLVGRRCRFVDLVQVRQQQVAADLVEHCGVDIADGDDDRRARIAGGKIDLGADGHRADDRRPIHEALNQGGVPAGICRILLGHDRNGVLRHGVEPAAHQVQRRGDLRAKIGEGGVGRRAEQRVCDAIVAVDDRHDVVVIKVDQPLGAAGHPLRIVSIANVFRCPFRRGGAVEFAQQAQALAGDGGFEQRLLASGRDFVGASCRGQHGDDDADDGDGDDAADRHDETEPRSVPARPLAFPGDMRLRRRQHASTL